MHQHVNVLQHTETDYCIYFAKQDQQLCELEKVVTKYACTIVQIMGGNT